MKTIYIPKGETIRYESLATEHLVVHGCLQVTCGITAKTITGYGTVHAGTVNADVIRVDDMDAGSIVCKRLLAKRVQSPEVFASESAAVSGFLSSAYVETGKLTVSGECSLIGMWENGGLYVSISQPACGSGKVLLYRTVRHSRDYKGGYNHFITRHEIEKWSYAHLLDALCALRKDWEFDEQAA